MKSDFRLYNSFKSSYFDLINGDRETQQTKGLGLLLSKSKPALNAFLNIEKVKSKIGTTKYDQFSRVIVNCELPSSSEKAFRLDILVRLYVDERPWRALLIEAKSVKKSVSQTDAKNQLKQYLAEGVFNELNEFGEGCTGITLTKSYLADTDEKYISLTWADVIKALQTKECMSQELTADFFNFLTNINGAMKFYEKEVYSIPTNEWSAQAINQFGIYECPNQGRFIIKQKPLFLTFRRSGGGEMDRLYKLQELVIINFSKDYDAFLNDSNFSEDYRNRVKGYINYLLENGVWNELHTDDKQVFILDKNPIVLKHKPKPRKRNNSYRAYYELADLLNNDLVDSVG